MEWFMKAIHKHANFKGRASQSEHRMFTLFAVFIVGVTFGVGTLLMSLLDRSGNRVGALIALVATVLASLLLVVPSLSAAVRRLHDVGNSGALIVWLVVIFVLDAATLAVDDGIGSVFSLVPLGFGIYLLFLLYFADSQVGPNQYGPNPKGIGNDFPSSHVSSNSDQTPTDTLVN